MKKIASAAQAGFTLIELLIATAITSIMIIVIMTFLVNTIVTNSVSSARADLLRETQLAMDMIARDVRLSATADENNRWADSNSPNAGATGGLGWESDDNTLILALAAQDADRNVIFDDALHYLTHKDNVIYFVENGTLYRRRLAGDHANNAALTSCPAATASCPADRVLIRGITSFSVTYFNSDNEEVGPVDARSIGLSIDVEQERYGRVVSANFATRTVFRNE